MKERNWFPKFCKSFGLIHVGFNSAIIAVILLCSAIFLFVAGPQMGEIKQAKPMMWQEARLKNVQQLFDGVYNDDITIIKEQLSNGVDVNAVNETHQTALHATQDADIARLLINIGGNIHEKDDAGMTPIFNKDIEIATILLDAGADVNARTRKGNTPFIWYTYSGYLDGLHFLVSRGADANACNVDNQNSLDIAEHFHPDTDVHKYLQSLNIQSCKE